MKKYEDNSIDEFVVEANEGIKQLITTIEALACLVICILLVILPIISIIIYFQNIIR